MRLRSSADNEQLLLSMQELTKLTAWHREIFLQHSELLNLYTYTERHISHTLCRHGMVFTHESLYRWTQVYCFVPHYPRCSGTVSEIRCFCIRDTVPLYPRYGASVSEIRCLCIRDTVPLISRYSSLDVTSGQ